MEYKRVHVGAERLSADYAAHLMRTDVAGITVSTDSSVLQEQLAIIAPLQATNETIPAILNYVVENQLPFRKRDGAPFGRLEKDDPGDIYASPDLQAFYFNGINKIGTLLSMAYGIRSLHSIAQDRLGLHAALLHDRDKGESSLLIGKNRSGKSSIGQLLEDSDSRFEMLTDDWAEVDLLNDVAKPVAVIFSPHHPSPRYHFLFQSFGKAFYGKTTDINPVKLSRVIEIHNGEPLNGSNAYITRCLTHIPFIAQPEATIDFLQPEIDTQNVLHRISERVTSLLVGYECLTERVPTYRLHNDPRSSNLEAVTASARAILESRNG